MNDLISRQAAIDLAMQYCPDDDGSCSKADRDIRELLDDLENMPSAQPEPHWIPCSERLPEEDTYVLATTAWGEVTMAEKLSDIDWFIYEGNANAKSDDIVAWMPLPEPYKYAT